MKLTWIALFCLAVSAPASAGTKFIRIADSSGEFSTAFGSFPSISNSGEVAFFAIKDNGATGVYKGSGGGLTTISGGIGPVQFQGEAVINNNGVVAFAGGFQTGGYGIFSGSGGAITTIAASGSQFVGFGGLASINDAGTVAFGAVLPNSNGQVAGLYSGSGGAITTLYGAGDSYLYPGFPAINNAGTIAFIAFTPATVFGLFAGDGGAPDLLARWPGPEFSGFANIFPPAINDAGSVAFLGISTDTGALGVYRHQGGANVLIADNSGAYASFSGPAINASGQVAFLAKLADQQSSGIFRGPDPIADAIIKTGDALDGSTVVSVRFGTTGLADDGSIAFGVSLADGRNGIYRTASVALVPEPSTLALCGLAVPAAIIARRRMKRS
jgi:hypothetical protein